MKKIVVCTFLALGLLMLTSCNKGDENVSIKSVKNAAVDQISASLSTYLDNIHITGIDKLADNTWFVRYDVINPPSHLNVEASYNLGITVKYVSDKNGYGGFFIQFTRYSAK